MRVSVSDWTKSVGLPITKDGMFSGFINSGHTMLIAPKSDIAKTSMMMEHGFEYSEEANKQFFSETSVPLGSALVTNVRMITNHDDVRIGQKVVDRKMFRILNKYYKRKKDAYSFLTNSYPHGVLRIVSPCEDWWIVIAPLMGEGNNPVDESQSTPVGLDGFSLDVLA